MQLRGRSARAGHDLLCRVILRNTARDFTDVVTMSCTPEQTRMTLLVADVCAPLVESKYADQIASLRSPRRIKA